MILAIDNSSFFKYIYSFEFHWFKNNEAINLRSSFAKGLGAGLYKIEIYDKNKCFIEKEIQLNTVDLGLGIYDFELILLWIISMISAIFIVLLWKVLIYF